MKNGPELSGIRVPFRLYTDRDGVGVSIQADVWLTSVGEVEDFLISNGIGRPAKLLSRSSENHQTGRVIKEGEQISPYFPRTTLRDVTLPEERKVVRYPVRQRQVPPPNTSR